ncbi:MAG: V-type ATPase 116kDa subunit family protein [Pyrobaculum sp.]
MPLEKVVEFRVAGSVDILPELIYFVGKTGVAMFEDRPEKLPRPRDPEAFQKFKRLNEILNQLALYVKPERTALPLVSLEKQVGEALAKAEEVYKEVMYYTKLVEELRAKLPIARELADVKTVPQPRTEVLETFIVLAGRSVKEVLELCKVHNASAVQRGSALLIAVEKRQAAQLRASIEKLGVPVFTLREAAEVEPPEVLQERLKKAEESLKAHLEKHGEFLKYAFTLRDAVQAIVDVYNRSVIDEGSEVGRLFASYDREIARLESQLASLSKIKTLLDALGGRQSLKIPEGFKLVIEPESVRGPHVVQEVGGLRVALVKGEVAGGVEVPAEYLADIPTGRRVVEDAVKSAEAALKRLRKEREVLERLYAEYSVYGDKKWEERKDVASLVFYVLERHVDKIDKALEEFIKNNIGKLDIVKRIRYKYFDKVPVERRPTLERYPTPIKQFTKIVYMYGVPKSNEISPVPLAALLFPVFFGWMYGDLGHGFLLFILGVLLLTKLYGGRHKEWGVIWALTGLTAMFFGAFVYHEAFGFGLKELGIKMPMEPVLHLFGGEGVGVDVVGVKHALAAAFLLGFLLVLLAFISKFINTVIKGEPDVAVGLVTPTLLIFFSLGMLFFSLVGGSLGMHYLEPLYKLPWMYVFLGAVAWSVAGMLALRARYRHYEEAPPVTEEFVLGFVEGSLGALANIPSFSRLVILIMIHGVLTKLVNGVAASIGLPGGLLFAIFGHSLIAAAEGLFSLVQSLRLIFYETLSKFYEGRGRLFLPLALP